MEKVTPDEVKLVLARLETLRPNLKLAIGLDSGNIQLTKAEIIEHIKENDEIGIAIVNAYMRYLRSFKEDA